MVNNRRRKLEAGAKEIKKPGPGVKPCSLCHQKGIYNNDSHNLLQKAGNFFLLKSNATNTSYFFHFFCLLYSDGKQRGEDQEGISGFLKADAINVVTNSKKHKCIYCNENNAATKCEKCHKRYHYICGNEKGATFISTKNSTKSYCHLHFPMSKNRLRFPDRICYSGCSEKVLETEKSLISTCCGRAFHKDCVQNMALTYGRHHLKCPLCSDKESFILEAERIGVYIPFKDADWEIPENEEFYQHTNMNEQYTTCDAKNCACNKGRKYSLPGTRFEIIRCSYCGSGAIHIYCGGLKRKAPFYVCDQHESSLEDMKDHEKKAKKKLKELNIDDNDDEICPINDEHLIRHSTGSTVNTKIITNNTSSSSPNSNVNTTSPRSSATSSRSSTTSINATKISDLRKTLSDLGLSATGSRDALLARLRLHEENQKKKKNERGESTTSSVATSLLQTNLPNNSTRKMTSGPGKKKTRETAQQSSSSSLQDNAKVISTKSSRKSKENRKRTSNASVDENMETIIDLSDDDDDEPMVTYQGPVQVPFKLLNPITNQYKVMPVMTYELNPSMDIGQLDGLALRLHEKRQKTHQKVQQQPLKYSSNLHHSDDDEEIVLSD